MPPHLSWRVASPLARLVGWACCPFSRQLACVRCPLLSCRWARSRQPCLSRAWPAIRPCSPSRGKMSAPKIRRLGESAGFHSEGIHLTTSRASWLIRRAQILRHRDDIDPAELRPFEKQSATHMLSTNTTCTRLQDSDEDRRRLSASSAALPSRMDMLSAYCHGLDTRTFQEAPRSCPSCIGIAPASREAGPGMSDPSGLKSAQVSCLSTRASANI